jgi:hypothetical protein
MATRTSLLDAVNQMLSCIGGAAVVTIDTDNPEVQSAVAILEETTRTVLAEGWNFNTEYEYPFAPDTNKQILVPSNLISFTPSFGKHGADYQIVERQGKLYDKLKHSYSFNESIYCDVIWGFEFTDCPQPFKEYITARSSRAYASRLVSSREQVELIAQDEASCRALCLAYDTETSRPSMFGLENGQNTHISYLPYRTLVR